ncbi:MAG: amidohydrolase family protein [Mycetocola reblochoni]|uniref:Mll5767 protein n=2 Tax=Mycetocola reblochoni TaxID=331618 RepID=A0A1R4KAH6_9MICO|nr:amidohydrolase family protein [Mycetocola reblochoni]RLP71181.1 thioesterase [Mycetocola reblochoni]SJN41135.1 Mll5767 protein [Mycetocola reblochoni REB411]
MTRYAGPIVDAHHHFWTPEEGRQPWLRPDARIPFRYGDYESIKRSYLPPDLLRDAEGLNLVGTVTMETEWELDDPVGEMDWTAGVAERYGLPSAAVAHAVLRDERVEGVLEQLAERPLVRAVRNKPGQAASAAEAAANPNLLDDPSWRRGYALLTRYGLDFELQTAWWHVDQAVRLAADFPDTAIAINHTFLPSDRSSEGIAGWRRALVRVAAFDNVTIKISGIGLPGVPWSVENNREIVETTAEVFGPDRIMFASNFPVDGLTGSYRQIMGGFLEIAEGWSESEQRRAFAGNAVRVYRLPSALAGAD